MLQKSYKLAKLCIIALLFIAPAMCQAATGPQATAVLFLKFADHPEDGTCTTAEAGDIVFNQYGSWLAAESRGLESVTGSTVYGPATLPYPVSHYNCTVGQGYTEPALPSCSGDLMSDSMAATSTYFNWHNKDLVVFVYNFGFGAATGAPFIQTTCQRPECPTCAHLDLGTMKHEGGHAQEERLFHAAGWGCPGADVGPDLENPNNGGGCGWTAYGDPYDPMGSGLGTSGHYSTYMRDRLNWQSASNILTVNFSTQQTLRRADVSSNELQELRLHLGYAVNFPTYEYFYTLEYRPDVGGVLIRYRGCGDCAGAETFLINNGAPITLTDMFSDPYRHITVSLVDSDGEHATVHAEYIGSTEEPETHFKKGHHP